MGSSSPPGPGGPLSDAASPGAGDIEPVRQRVLEHLRAVLARFAGTPLAACGTGCVVTAAWQSSSLTSVTVVGLVHAGVLPLGRAVADKIRAIFAEEA